MDSARLCGTQRPYNLKLEGRVEGGGNGVGGGGRRMRKWGVGGWGAWLEHHYILLGTRLNFFKECQPVLNFHYYLAEGSSS